MDRDYRSTAKVYHFPIDRVKGDDLSRFRIERARFRSSWCFLGLTAASITGYGWALAREVVGFSPCIYDTHAYLRSNLEHLRPFDTSIFHRCLDHLFVQHVRYSPYRLEPTEPCSCASRIKHHPVYLVGDRTCGAATHD